MDQSNQPSPQSQPIHTAVIFIVDDEEVICHALMCQLMVAGFVDIHCFNSVIDVLKAMRNMKPDLILTDIHMPDANGRFLTQLLKSSGDLAAIPIIAITADEDVKIANSLLREGVAAILQKPVADDALIDCVTSTIMKSRSVDNFANNAEQANQQKSETSAKIMNQETELRELFGRTGGVDKGDEKSNDQSGGER